MDTTGLDKPRSLEIPGARDDDAREFPRDRQPKVPTIQDEPESRPGGIPLYVWVDRRGPGRDPGGTGLGRRRDPPGAPAQLILRALTALAAPLVVLAILSAIVTNEIRGRLGALMMVFYLINTLVAMIIGLTLTNLIRPGIGASLSGPVPPAPVRRQKSIPELLLDLIPRSIGEPFTQNHLAQLVVLTLALGIGLVKIRDGQKARGETSFQVVVDLLTIGFELLMKVLLWVVALVAAGGLRRRGLERRSSGRDERSSRR